MVHPFNLKTNEKGETYEFNRFIDTDGKVINRNYASGASETWYDCSIFNCEDGTKIKVLKVKIFGAILERGKKKLNLKRKLNGKTFARIKNENNIIK